MQIDIKVGNTYKLIDTIKHQGIGGQEIRIDFEVSVDEVDSKAMQGNPACFNFTLRRDDFLPDFNKKCYYGHVGNLGYVVCEDEIVEEVK